MADVGGLAGILLGISILSGYDTILRHIHKLKNVNVMSKAWNKVIHAI